MILKNAYLRMAGIVVMHARPVSLEKFLDRAIYIVVVLIKCH
jgi:hypothetical protein